MPITWTTKVDGVDTVHAADINNIQALLDQSIKTTDIPQFSGFPSVGVSWDIWDEFQRVNSTGSLGNSPTGQSWTMTGEGYLLAGITSHRMVCPQGHTVYSYLPFSGQNIRFGGKCSWVSGAGSDPASVALLCSKDVSLLDNMVHLFVAPTAWGLGYAVSGGGIVTLASGSFSPNLLTDGTVYEMYLTVIGNRAYCELPGGSSFSAYYSGLNALIGNYVCWELTSTGTSVLNRWEKAICSEAPASAAIKGVPSGGILFGDTNGIGITDPEFFWDNVNKRLGVYCGSAPFCYFQIGQPAGANLGACSLYMSIFGAYDANRGLLTLAVNNAATADYGPIINFSGETGQAATPYAYAQIKGAKESGGGYNGYLAFLTTASSSAFVEAMRIKSNQIINMRALPSYATDALAGVGGLVTGDLYTVLATSPLQIAQKV